MCPERPHGFAIVSAIFIVVVLAALGAFIATVATTQHAGTALDVSGARAYQAARAGTEWGLFKALKDSSCLASTDLTIDGMQVSVTCAVVVSGSAIEAGLGSIYRITATACNLPTGTACPGNAAASNYVERRIEAVAER